MKSSLPMYPLLAAAAFALSSCASTVDETAMSPAAKSAKHMAHGHASSAYDIPGYTTIEEDGRLWVFETGSADLAKFMKEGEPAKIVVLPGVGPDGMTLKGTERDVMLEYALTKPGYKVFMDDGRLWVFEEGSKDLAQFEEHGEPAKMVVLPGAGPRGMTLKGTDRDTMMEYALTKPGYKVIKDDGRLWVFKEGSKDLAQFEEHGEPAKMVVLPGAGPRGLTLKGTDRDTMLEYALTKPGFTVMIEDGRLWVFRTGSEALAQFHEHGEPAKIVVRPGAGPRRMTLKSVDGTILDAYMAAN
jgi:sugar lactone lactonase YvrE